MSAPQNAISDAQQASVDLVVQMARAITKVAASSGEVIYADAAVRAVALVIASSAINGQEREAIRAGARMLKDLAERFPVGGLK